MRPSMAKAVKAKCRECCGGYVDGRIDCEIHWCSLYYWMPYRKLEPTMEWVPPKREISDAHREKLQAMMRQRLSKPATQIGEET